MSSVSSCIAFVATVVAIPHIIILVSEAVLAEEQVLLGSGPKRDDPSVMAAEAGFHAVPHRGDVQVFYHNGEPFLHNAGTDEVAPLGARGVRPILCTSPEGWAYVRLGDGSTRWAEQLFRFHIFETLDGSRVVLRRCDDGSIVGPGIALDSFARHFRLASTRVRVGAGAAEQLWVCQVSHRAVHGAFLFWSLRSLYTNFAGDATRGLKYKKFREQKWPSIRKLVEELGFHPSHARPSTRAVASADVPEVAEQGFTFASVSSYGLVAIVSRWAGATTRRAGCWAAGRAPAEELLVALLKQMPATQIVVPVTSDPQWVPPWIVRGAGRVVLEVMGGNLQNLERLLDAVVRTHRLQRKEREGFHEVCEALGGLEQVPFHMFFAKIMAHMDLRWIQKPLVWQVGAYLEAQLRGGVLLPDPGQVDADSFELPETAQIIFTWRGLDMDLRQRHSFLCAYAAKNDELINTDGVLNVCFDGSRVGRRPVMLFMACRGNNKACWLPPKVHEQGFVNLSCRLHKCCFWFR